MDHMDTYHMDTYHIDTYHKPKRVENTQRAVLI